MPAMIGIFSINEKLTEQNLLSKNEMDTENSR